MQTFLPYSSFRESASCLDNSRLNKQISEVLQIHRSLTNGGGWASHPASRMWKGYEHALIRYGLFCYREWRARWRSGARGGKLSHKSGDQLLALYTRTRSPKPPWCFDPAFQRAHRSNLLRKLPAHYSHYWKDVPDNLPYVWPV
jgi:hypothetical protein